MKPKHASLFSCSALALACAGSAAFADITSQEVWDKMRAYYEVQGISMSATETVTDTGVTLTDMVFTSPEGMEGEPDVTMSMSGWTLTDQADGTVSLSWVEPMVLTFDIVEPGIASDMDDDTDATDDMEAQSMDQGAMKDDDKKGDDDSAVGDDMATDTGDAMSDTMPGEGEHIRFVLSLTHDSPSVVISGSADDMTTTYGAVLASMNLDSVEVDGEAIGNAQFNLKIANPGTVTRMVTTDTTYQFDTTYDMGATSYDLSVIIPEEEGNIQMNGEWANLTAGFDGTFPLDWDPIDMAANMAAGFDMKGSAQIGASNSSFNFQVNGELVSGTSGSSGGEFALAMGPAGLHIDGASRDVDYAIQGSEIPFPISLKATEFGMGFTMPIMESDVPQDFGLKLSLRDLAVDDLLWMLIDPTGAVPHDPATLVVDLAGKANWLVNIMDPAVQAELDDSDEVPAELHALTLNDLQLKLAGAELTGTGDFTFNNDDLETFDGLPAPDGSVALKLTGGNTLLTTLIDMGLIPEDEALGIRMMLGIFTSPVEGEDDTLTSTLEVKSDGSISANGQRLQ